MLKWPVAEETAQVGAPVIDGMAAPIGKLMAASGMSSSEIDAKLGSPSYWGIKKKIRQLGDWIRNHFATTGGTPCRVSRLVAG